MGAIVPFPIGGRLGFYPRRRAARGKRTFVEPAAGSESMADSHQPEELADLVGAQLWPLVLAVAGLLSTGQSDVAAVMLRGWQDGDIHTDELLELSQTYLAVAGLNPAFSDGDGPGGRWIDPTAAAHAGQTADAATGATNHLEAEAQLQFARLEPWPVIPEL